MYRLLSLFIVVTAAAVAAGPGCTTITCGVGTIEKNGECAPADDATGSALCGSGTELVGDRCVTTVTCGANTMPQVGSDGTVTCVGTGVQLDCSQQLPCPQPDAGKMTICGQLYNIETMQPFRPTTGSASGTPCSTATTDGPCALRMDAYDAIDFANHAGSGSAATPLAVGGTYMDDCGRYRFENVPQPSSPFVGLGFDDKDAAKAGPAGVTNAVGVATAFNGDNTVSLEAFIATKATTDMWSSTSGAPTVAQGIYVPIFRAHKCDATTGICNGDAFAPQSGVTIYKNTQQVPNNDFYFSDTGVGHTMIDTALTATGSDGTGLLTGASVADQLAWTGMGGITDTVNCKWENHAAASLANIVTFQIYRPTNQLGKTCNQ